MDIISTLKNLQYIYESIYVGGDLEAFFYDAYCRIDCRDKKSLKNVPLLNNNTIVMLPALKI